MKLMFSLILALSFNATAALKEAEFDGVLSRIETHYAPVFAAKGMELSLRKLWSLNDRYLDAQFENKTGPRIVRVFGGYARMPNMTKDALLLATCHEIGHHLGGYPLFNDEWASAEGQADYFASSKCMRNVLKNDSENRLVNERKINRSVKNKCRSQFALDDDYKICLRTIVAAEICAKSLYAIRNERVPVFFGASYPNRNAVVETDLTATDNQCRFDTFLSGALCKVDSTIEMNNSDETIGTCGFDEIGARPKCWFKSGF